MKLVNKQNMERRGMKDIVLLERFPSKIKSADKQNIENHGGKDIKIVLERFPSDTTKRSSKKTNPYKKDLQNHNTSQIAKKLKIKQGLSKKNDICHDYKLNVPCTVLLEKCSIEKPNNVSSNKTSHTDDVYSRKKTTKIPGRNNTGPFSATVEENSAVAHVAPHNNILSNKENILHDHKFHLECKVVLEDFQIETGETASKKTQNNDTAENHGKEVNSRNILSVDVNTNTKIQNNMKSRVQFNVKDNANSDLGFQDTRLPIDTLIMPPCQNKLVSSTPVKGNRRHCSEWLLNNSQILTPKSKKNDNKKLPIYRQHVIDNEKKTDNLYEFDEIDSGSVKKIRKRRKRIPKPKEARKPVYNILQNMMHQKVSNVKRNKITRPKKLQTTKINKSYDEIVEEIVQKIIDKNHIRSSIRPPLTDPVSVEDKVNKSHTIRRSPIVVSMDRVLNGNTMQEQEIAFDNISNENLDDAISDTEDRLEPHFEPNKDHFEPHFEPINSEDRYFGFESENSGTPSQINILSDITLNENIPPNANSTMLNVRKCSPWRFNENVKRNPHYINIKKTALPCLQQDMVIDYSQLEKFLEHFSKYTSRIESPRRSPIQTSMLDYVTNSNATDNQENIPHPSLFDYDDFNPHNTKLSNNIINKSKRTVLGPLQVNASSNSDESVQSFDYNDFNPRNTKLPNNIMKKSKRTVLGPLQVSISSNSDESVQGQAINRSKPLAQINRDPDITYFGFDDDNEENVFENYSQEKRPFRFREVPARKKNVPVIEKNVPASPPRVLPAVAQALSTPASPVENQPEIEDVGCKLFEDPEPEVSVTLPLKIYERNKRKRKIMLNELENHEDVNKKRHKKDIMTKAEEAELDKWAAKFNSDCEEIDKHELEYD